MKIGITSSVILVVLAAAIAHAATSRSSKADPSLSQEKPSCNAPSPMVISNTSAIYEWWKYAAPSAQPLLKVYIYNYTNAWTFGSSDEKFRVEEVGPFTYREYTQKVQIVFHNDSTVSYREKKTYEFLPEMSAYHEHTRVLVPNMMFIIILAASRDSDFESRLSMNTLLRTLNPKPFLSISVHDLLFGYEDILIKIVAGSQKFGLLDEGVSKAKFTVHTGVGDSCRLGETVGVDSESPELSLRSSGSDECHRVDGSPDGRQFPPALVADGASPLHLYSTDLYRRLPLQREIINVPSAAATEAGGAVAYRYRMPANVFGDPTRNPENRCFCPHDDPAECLPSGVFNASSYADGSPIVVSSPHFLYGDASLRSEVLGLQPDPEKHDTTVDVDPALGVAVGGAVRLQLNVQLRKAAGVMERILRHFKDLSILPIMWKERGYTRDNLLGLGLEGRRNRFDVFNY